MRASAGCRRTRWKRRFCPSAHWSTTSCWDRNAAPLSSCGLLRKEAAAVYAARQLEIQKVRYEKVSRPVSSLSGGNQQKVALARVLAGPVRFVVLEQPGRGLDLKARVELGRRVRALNREGVGFLVISHDSEELLALCDRVGIVYRGRLAGITTIGEASPELLARWMLGVKNGEHD